LSFETPDRRTIFAFCRLRVGGQPGGRDDGLSHVNTAGRKRRNNNIKASAEDGHVDGSSSSSSSSSSGDMDDGLGEVVFPELQDCALVRELHVYGQLATADAGGKNILAVPAAASSSSSSGDNSTAPNVASSGSSVVELDDDSNNGSLDDSNNSKSSSNANNSGSSILSATVATITTKREKSKSQHVGLGTRLMQHAEKMAAYHGYGKVAVISGVGVRHYYRRLG